MSSIIIIIFFFFFFFFFFCLFVCLCVFTKSTSVKQQQKNACIALTRMDTHSVALSKLSLSIAEIKVYFMRR